MKSFLIELTLDVDEDAEDAGVTAKDVAGIFADFETGVGVLTVENISETE